MKVVDHASLEVNTIMQLFNFITKYNYASIQVSNYASILV